MKYVLAYVKQREIYIDSFGAHGMPEMISDDHIWYYMDYGIMNMTCKAIDSRDFVRDVFPKLRYFLGYDYSIKILKEMILALGVVE